MMKGLDKNYWRYWIASAASQSASNVLQYVVSLYVLEITGSATLFASMLSIIIFPRLALTPISGVIADRVKKIRLMSWIVLGEAIALGFYCVLAQMCSVNVFMIFILVILLEVGEVFYAGPAAAIIPELVEESKLKDAIVISKVDDGIVVVAAPMIAAFLYENLSLSWAFGVVCILNFMAFLLQRRIQPKYEVKQEKAKKKSSYIADFREGIKVIQNDGFLRNFMKVLPVVNAFFGATFSVSIMYLLREVYGLSAYMYGLYCTITASMSMVSPLIVAPFVKKYPASKVFATVTMLIAIEIAGIGVFAFCGVNGVMPVLVSVIGITFLDCLTILAAIPMQMSGSILLQTNIKKELLGRVSSVIQMVSIAAVAAGEMLFGCLNDVINVWIPILIGAVGVGVASVLYRITLKNVEKRLMNG